MEKQELKDLTISVYDRLIRAIEQDDRVKAKELIDEIERNKYDFDNAYRQMLDIMLTYIADKLGEDALYEIHRLNGERSIWPRFGWAFDETTGVEDKVRRRAHAWTDWHCINIDEITEDDEKFSIKYKCPSGGTVRMWQEHGKTKEGHPWSWGEKGFSYYCLHCPVIFDIMSIERHGHQPWITIQHPEGHCELQLYKDPARIPEEYYQRVGMKKSG
jgi:hypothetical protein